MRADIVLSALTEGIEPRVRRIRLDSSTNSMPVGRSSKSARKNYHSSEDNAWFDSPVMSRDHAKLTFNMDDNTILLEDIGSMHGTCVNYQRLEQKTPLVLSSGDVLTFGAEVKRNATTYEACNFTLDYEILPLKQRHPSTFSVPDSSDDEDEALADNDDSDNEASVIVTSSMPRKPIDLTSEASASEPEHKTSSSPVFIDSDDDSDSCEEVHEQTTNFAQISDLASVQPLIEMVEDSFSLPVLSEVVDGKEIAGAAEVVMEESQPSSNSQSMEPSDADSEIPDSDEGFDFSEEELDLDITGENPMSVHSFGSELPAEQPGGLDREPSPSDAALVKDSSRRPTESIVPGFTTQSYQFTAREFPDASASAHTTRKAVHPWDSLDLPPLRPENDHMALNNLQMNFTPLYPAIPSPAASKSTAPGDNLEHTEEQTFQPEPFLEPQPDMTSAAKFNESKKYAMVAKALREMRHKQTLDLHKELDPPVDQCIEPSSIMDLPGANSASPVPEPASKKRKHDQISEVLEEEMRVWAASAPFTAKDSDVSVRESMDTELVSDGPYCDEDADQVDPVARPPKRFRRFVEAAGYAALGGAAVGAGLFTFLAATAPDFL